MTTYEELCRESLESTQGEILLPSGITLCWFQKFQSIFERYEQQTIYYYIKMQDGICYSLCHFDDRYDQYDHQEMINALVMDLDK